MVAQRLGAWVARDDVPDVWEAVIKVYRDYGYRRLRNRARLKFLVADWGAEKFREVLEREYLGRALADGPAGGTDRPARPCGDLAADRRSVLRGRRTDRRTGVGDHADGDRRPHGTGRLAAAAAHRTAEASHPGCRAARRPGDRSGDVGPASAAHRVRRGAMACTGIEFCKLAIVETKARTADLVDRLEGHFGEKLDGTDLSIHVNGCPNSCARFQIADIGFRVLWCPTPMARWWRVSRSTSAAGWATGRFRAQVAGVEGHR